MSNLGYELRKLIRYDKKVNNLGVDIYYFKNINYLFY